MVEIIKTLLDKIYETFIFDNRYLFFVEGLKNTLLLTLGSFVFGTISGVLLCATQRAKNKVINRIGRFIVHTLMEIPTMVLLMIMVYIIFGNSVVPVIWIVVVGLTLKAGAYLSEIFNSAISTVDKGEIEAARTLGMSRWQAFKNVTLPQTVERALPLYMNQFIATMQETSVVGYLAIVDLTRASSIVSSRTLDAFFGIIAVTLIYFIIGFIVKKVFNIFISRSRKGEAA